MSDPSASMIHSSTGVNITGGELINTGPSGGTIVNKINNNLNIGFPDVTGFFYFAAKHFVAWIGSKEPDPVQIGDMVPPDPSSLPPVSSIADRYTRSMLECTAGYPLYNPTPFSDLSMEYPRNGVNVGDVGFVTEDGTFDFLFNICRSQKISINPPDIPNSFYLEKLDHSTTRAQESLPCNKCIIPRTVEITESGEYICKGSEGAILELPEGAIRNVAVKKKPFEDLAKLRGVQWYKYAMARGRSVSNGSLYLVTSFTKCTKWGIAVFDRPCGPGQGLTFVSGPFSWKGSRIFTTKVVEPNKGDTPNQCVFLRGYKIMIRRDIFDDLCNDQPCESEPPLLSSDASSPQAGSISLTRQPAQHIRGGGGIDILSRIRNIGRFFNRTVRTTNSTIATVKKSDEVALHADFDSSPFHPSDLINAALLSQNLYPDVRVALTHDDVWCDLLQNTFPTLNYATLINIARSYTSMVDDHGCVSLQKISDPSGVVDESRHPVRETETSALQPNQCVRDERNPDISMPVQAESRYPVRGTEAPVLQESIRVRYNRDPDSSVLSQVSITPPPQSINQSLGAGDESTSVVLVASHALPTSLTTPELDFPRVHYRPKPSIEKAKVNKALNEAFDSITKIMQKDNSNMGGENHWIELYDPLEHLMNKLTSILFLQEIPKNDSSQSTGAVSTDRIPQSSVPRVDISDLVPADPSKSLLPVASIAARYTRSMLGCMAGYPLYEPQPVFIELSMDYSCNASVSVGDVGFVTDDGTFDFLFNVCPTQKGLFNPPNLPNGFSLSAPEHSKTRSLTPFPYKTCLLSPTVTRTKTGKYICEGSEGAVLELPEGAIQAEAINTKPFEDLAKLHGVQWYAYAMARDRSILNGSLCLITSFTKCTQWGIAVFDRPCAPGQGLKFDKIRSFPFGKPTSKYRWNGSGAFLTKVANPNTGGAPDQCVFLRGYKIKIRQDIFDNLYNDQLSGSEILLSSSLQAGSSGLAVGHGSGLRAVGVAPSREPRPERGISTRS